MEYRCEVVMEASDPEPLNIAQPGMVATISPSSTHTTAIPSQVQRVEFFMGQVLSRKTKNGPRH